MGALHGSVNTAEMPDVMCSLETFVTVIGAVAEVSFFRHCAADFKGGNDMDFWNAFASLFSNFGNLTWQMVVMWGIGALLIYLAIAKKMEPSLLLPMGFGAILVNLPLSGAITQGDTVGPISALFEAGMSNELFPLLLFIGIGAMIDFGPLLEKPC